MQLKQVEEQNEPEKVVVVPPTDTGSQPRTVMVEFHNAVVAQVAVGSLLRSKDKACLTILESGYCSV